MSRVAPYDTAPQLMERKTGLVDMMVRNEPGIRSYRFWGAPTINDAYGNPVGSGVGGAGPEAMFTVDAELQFRSPSIILRGWSWYGETLRGMSRVAFAPDDYASDPTTSFPGDADMWFLRVQERRASSGGAAASTAIVDLNAVGVGDTLTISGVLFSAIVGPGVPAAQTFDGSAGGVVAATELVATVNDPASQALLLAAAPAGISVTASIAGVGYVKLTATVSGTAGDAITLLAAGGIVVSGPTLAGGGETYLTVQGPVNHGDPKLGSIYACPPPTWFGHPNPGLTLWGTAPAGTGAVAGSIPPISPDMQIPNPMHIILPRWTTSCFVDNVGAADLYCSTGWGIPMLSVAAADGPVEFGGGVKELVLAGAAATAFTITSTIALGPGG